MGVDIYNFSDEDIVREARLLSSEFRKKPVVIRAIQLAKSFVVPTLEGEMRGKAGDYLVFGIKDEMYPVDKEIFLATYEPVITKKGEDGSSGNYGIEKIKQAFWATFHKRGEMFFDYLHGEEESGECTHYYWTEFERELTG